MKAFRLILIIEDEVQTRNVPRIVRHRFEENASMKCLLLTQFGFFNARRKATRKAYEEVSLSGLAGATIHTIEARMQLHNKAASRGKGREVEVRVRKG